MASSSSTCSLLALGTLLLALIALALPCGAAEIPGELLVSVKDAVSGAPIADASVAVLGSGPSQAFSKLSNPTGTASFEALQPGSYRILIHRAGYIDSHWLVDVIEAHRTVVRFDLQPSIKTIGRIITKAKVSVFVQSINENSALRRLSWSLVDALSSLAGVQAQVGPGSFGPSVSLRNEDSSLTSYRLNGVPVDSAAILATNTDLLSSAVVNQANDTVNFVFLSPTVAPRYQVVGAAGSNRAFSEKITGQGTAGDVGFAFAHTIGGTNSALHGMTYLDSSGLSYRHVGTYVSPGDFWKIAAPVGNWSASLMDSYSSSYLAPIATYQAGPLPAGIGPGNFQTSTSHNGLFSLNGTLGATAVSLSAAGWRFITNVDEAHRIVALQALPFSQRISVSGTDVTLTLSGSPSDHRSSELQLSRSATFQSGDERDPAAPIPALSVARAYVQTSIEGRETWRASDRLRFTLGTTLARSTLSPWVADYRANVSWQPTASDRYEFVISDGARPLDSDALSNPQTFVDAAQASYDCNARTVSVPVPGDRAATPFSARYKLAWSRQLRAGYASLSLYDERLGDVLLTGASVPASTARAGFLPNGYVAALQSGFARFGRCQGTPPSPASIFLVQDIGGLSTRYRGGAASVTFDVSRHLQLQADYETAVAILASSDARMTAPTSTYVPGQQLPNKPLHRGALTADWQLGDQKTELIANSAIVSANNARNLPLYATWNAGIVHNFSSRLSLAVVGSNITNAYAGMFVSPKYAVELPTVSGQPLATVAAPLPYSRVSVRLTYTVDHSGF